MKYILRCKQFDKWRLGWNDASLVIDGHELILGVFDTREEAEWVKCEYQEKFIEDSANAIQPFEPRTIHRNLQQFILFLIVNTTFDMKKIGKDYPNLLLYDFEIATLMD
jgi:hypothetical protein